MVKECLDYAVLIAHENIDEIYRQRVQVSLDDWDVTKICQVHLWHKAEQNLIDIDTYQNIRVIHHI